MLLTLTQSRYFSEKALTYPNDIDKIFNITDIKLHLFYPLKTLISSGCIFCFNIYIEHPNSLLYWIFKTENYDINFGVYKSNTLKEWKSEDLVKLGPSQAIIKLHKVNSSEKFTTVIFF